MKRIMMSLLLGVMLIGQLSVAHGLGVEENPFLQTSNEKIVKVNLDESRTIIEPTKDRGVIQEKLTTLTWSGQK